MGLAILVALFFQGILIAADKAICDNHVHEAIQKIFATVAQEWRYNSETHTGYDNLYSLLRERKVRVTFIMHPETVFDKSQGEWDWTFKVAYHIEGLEDQEWHLYEEEKRYFETDLNMVSFLLEALLSELFRAYCATHEQLLLARFFKVSLTY